jgi:alkylation response protein AidB-like acyl-CoA dehydrogenase
MNFRVNEEQRALQAGVRRFCAEQFGLDVLRRLEGRAVDRALWSALGELGVFSLHLPESAGGAGLGVPEVVLVFEELGRALVPGPLVWSVLAARLVPGAATGATIVTGLDALGAEGAHGPIELPAEVDGALVLGAEGVLYTPAPACGFASLDRPLDPLTPVGVAQGLRGARDAKTLGDASEARSLRRLGALLDAAFLLGSAQATLDLAVAHAKQREQFGRPIGSFQALKHMMADMFARQELARGAVYSAAAHVAAPEVGDVARAVSSARLVAHAAAEKNARASIQIHGGMGYTWEVPVHYHLKRVWVLESRFGSSGEHAEAVAQRVAEQNMEAGI